MKFINNDPIYQIVGKNILDEIGDELDVIVNEINGPSWSPTKKLIIMTKNFKNNEEIVRVN